MIQLSASLALGDAENQQSQTSDESAVGDDRQMPGVSASEALVPGGDKSSSQITTAPLTTSRIEFQGKPELSQPTHDHQDVVDLTNDSSHGQDTLEHRTISRTSKGLYEDRSQDQQSSIDDNQVEDFRTDDASALVNSQGSSLSARSLETRPYAFNTIFGESAGNYMWDGLISTTNNHTYPETELGEG